MKGTTNRIYRDLDGDDGLLLHESTQIARRLPFTRQKVSQKSVEHISSQLEMPVQKGRSVYLFNLCIL